MSLNDKACIMPVKVMSQTFAQQVSMLPGCCYVVRAGSGGSSGLPFLCNAEKVAEQIDVGVEQLVNTNVDVIAA